MRGLLVIRKLVNIIHCSMPILSAAGVRVELVLDGAVPLGHLPVGVDGGDGGG